MWTPDPRILKSFTIGIKIQNKRRDYTLKKDLHGHLNNRLTHTTHTQTDNSWLKSYNPGLVRLRLRSIPLLMCIKRLESDSPVYREEKTIKSTRSWCERCKRWAAQIICSQVSLLFFNVKTGVCSSGEGGGGGGGGDRKEMEIEKLMAETWKVFCVATDRNWMNDKEL